MFIREVENTLLSNYERYSCLKKYLEKNENASIIIGKINIEFIIKNTNYFKLHLLLIQKKIKFKMVFFFQNHLDIIHVSFIFKN